jgi:hypothetical protein
MRIFRNFTAAWRRADEKGLERGFGEGEGREFIEQDKGPAVRHGIFGGLCNELRAFLDGGRS